MLLSAMCGLISVALFMMPLGASGSVLRSNSENELAGSNTGAEPPIVNIHVPEDSMGMLERNEERTSHNVRLKALSRLEKRLHEFDQMVKGLVSALKNEALLTT